MTMATPNRSVPEGFGQEQKAEKPAAQAAPAPTDTRSDDKAQRDAEVGALRARVAELEAAQRRERRTSDPRGGDDYDPKLALAELWPAQLPGTHSD